MVPVVVTRVVYGYHQVITDVCGVRLVRCGGKSKRESSATESIEESATLPLPWIHYAEESLSMPYFSLARKRKTAMVV